MHTFQTYPSDMFEIDPFTKIGSEWMLITSVNPAIPKNLLIMVKHFR